MVRLSLHKNHLHKIIEFLEVVRFGDYINPTYCWVDIKTSLTREELKEKYPVII
jgi:hypothetical protein